MINKIAEVETSTSIVMTVVFTIQHEWLDEFVLKLMKNMLKLQKLKLHALNLLLMTVKSRLKHYSEDKINLWFGEQKKKKKKWWDVGYNTSIYTEGWKLYTIVVEKWEMPIN